MTAPARAPYSSPDWFEEMDTQAQNECLEVARWYQHEKPAKDICFWCSRSGQPNPTYSCAKKDCPTR